VKAIAYHAYGPPDVLRCEDLPTPTPAADQVLILVRTASVNPFDVHMMRGDPLVLRAMAGLRAPKNPRLGVDVAGEVAALGPDASRLKVGDHVFGTGRGSFAEYVCAAESALAVTPRALTFEQAAAAPVAGLTALQGLRDRGRLQAGQRVLINGAAGGVGTFAVQIAKASGAGVTAVCSGRNADLVRSIGADRVIDYTREDFTAGAERYDVILDCHAIRPLRDCMRVLTPKGIYVFVGGPGSGLLGPMARALEGAVLSPFVRQTLTMVGAKSGAQDLAALRALLERGKVVPVIDRTYRLPDVPDAIRYLEEGHARGKVVITV